MQYSGRTASSLAGFTLLAASGTAVAASAESSSSVASGDAAESTAALADIVVTARKREETLYDAPVAVSALTAADLQERNVTTLEDVARFVPSLTASSTGGSANSRVQQTLVIRGLTPPGQTATSRTTTVFVDGAPLSGQGVIGGLWDLAQVEVIKGPQSAYFGRQTFAGAVNLVTRRPGDEFDAVTDVMLGSDSLLDARLALGGPVISDRLGVRVSARYYSMDGQYPSPDVPGLRYGGQSSRNFTIALRFTPFDGLEARLFGLYAYDYDGISLVNKYTTADYNCNAGGAPVGQVNFICGRLPYRPAVPSGQNPAYPPEFAALLGSTPLRFDIGLKRPGAANRLLHGNFVVDYELPSIGGRVTSVTAGNETLGDNIFDAANVFVPVASSWMLETQNSNSAISQELRISAGEDRRLRWSAGYNYYTERVGQMNLGQIAPFGIAIIYSPGAPNKVVSNAVFASASFAIAPRWTLNLEGRYAVDDVSGYDRVVTADGAVREPVTQKVTDRSFTPRVIVQYQFAERGQVYATLSRGINPSTFNSFSQYTPEQIEEIRRTTGAGLSTGPEKLDNVELGVKAALLGGRLGVDASVYYAKWRDQIVQQTIYLSDPSGITVASGYSNGGSTRLHGVEASLRFQPVDGLELGLDAAVNESRVITNACSYCAALTTTLPPNTPAPLDLYEGNELPNYSKYSAALMAAYERSVGPDLLAYGRLDYTFKSGMWDSVANLNRTQDAHRVDLRIGLQRGRYRVEAFGTNLFNDRALTSTESNVDVLSPGLSARVTNAGLPRLRQGGVRVLARW